MAATLNDVITEAWKITGAALAFFTTIGGGWWAFVSYKRKAYEEKKAAEFNGLITVVNEAVAAIKENTQAVIVISKEQGIIKTDIHYMKEDLHELKKLPQRIDDIDSRVRIMEQEK